MQQVREDREKKVSQVQALSIDLENHKERTGKSVADLDNLTLKSNALEETCSS